MLFLFFESYRSCFSCLPAPNLVFILNLDQFLLLVCTYTLFSFMVQVFIKLKSWFNPFLEVNSVYLHEKETVIIWFYRSILYHSHINIYYYRSEKCFKFLLSTYFRFYFTWENYLSTYGEDAFHCIEYQSTAKTIMNSRKAHKLVIVTILTIEKFVGRINEGKSFPMLGEVHNWASWLNHVNACKCLYMTEVNDFIYLSCWRIFKSFLLWNVLGSSKAMIFFD